MSPNASENTDATIAVDVVRGTGSYQCVPATTDSDENSDVIFRRQLPWCSPMGVRARRQNRRVVISGHLLMELRARRVTMKGGVG